MYRRKSKIPVRGVDQGVETRHIGVRDEVRYTQDGDILQWFCVEDIPMMGFVVHRQIQGVMHNNLNDRPVVTGVFTSWLEGTCGLRSKEG